MPYERVEEVVTAKLTESLARPNTILGEVGQETSTRLVGILSVLALTPAVRWPHYFAVEIGNFRGHGYDFEKKGIPHEPPSRALYETHLELAKRVPEQVVNEGIEEGRYGWLIERADRELDIDTEEISGIVAFLPPVIPVIFDRGLQEDNRSVSERVADKVFGKGFDVKKHKRKLDPGRYKRLNFTFEAYYDFEGPKQELWLDDIRAPNYPDIITSSLVHDILSGLVYATEERWQFRQVGFRRKGWARNVMQIRVNDRTDAESRARSIIDFYLDKREAIAAALAEIEKAYPISDENGRLLKHRFKHQLGLDYLSADF